MVGRIATPELTKLAPQVIALAVPLSLMRIVSRCPSVGTPVTVTLVIATASAVR